MESHQDIHCGGHGRKSWKLKLGILQTSPKAPSPYVNFCAYFSVINHSWEYNYMLSPTSPPANHQIGGVVLQTSCNIHLSYLNQTLEIQIKM